MPASPLDNSTAPLISLITPSFNQAQFVRQTIESILTQDYAKFEYWVVDGASTDSTVAILREYESDKRFNWLSEPDAGQSEAINKGLVRCRGDLFAWINSDDVLLPGALRSMAEAWRAANQPRILYGLGRYINEHGEDLGYCPGQTTHMTMDKLLQVGRHTLVQPATFVPTEAVRQVGGLDPAKHFALDLDLWLKLAAALPVEYVGRDIALYRLHSTSKTVHSPPRFVDEVRLILSRAAEQGLLPARQAQCRAELFGLRTFLMPGALDPAQAWRCLWAAARIDLTSLPKSAAIILKAGVRFAAGERAWAWGRLAKARWG